MAGGFVSDEPANTGIGAPLIIWYSHMYACIHIYTSTYLRIHLCTVYAYTGECTGMHVCMHVCMYVRNVYINIHNGFGSYKYSVVIINLIDINSFLQQQWQISA